MSEKLLITYKADYADEFNVYAFKIFEINEWNKLAHALENYDYEFSVVFGTNEEISYADGSTLLDDIEIKLISEDEYNIIKKVFFNNDSDLMNEGYGTTEVFDSIYEAASLIEDLEEADNAEEIGDSY